MAAQSERNSMMPLVYTRDFLKAVTIDMLTDMIRPMVRNVAREAFVQE